MGPDRGSTFGLAVVVHVMIDYFAVARSVVSYSSGGGGPGGGGDGGGVVIVVGW